MVVHLLLYELFPATTKEKQQYIIMVIIIMVMSNPTLFKYLQQKVFTVKQNLMYIFSYRISSDIRQIFSFQNNPKDLDPSYKTDLDL